ncbi:hypothetical protein G6F56_005103 [Rhizopus delemar]|nr:hypothetical protein G6F56_005103 [Rhizopus delemar]
MEAASKTLTPAIWISVENVFVAPDADLYMTARRVLLGKFYGAGKLIYERYGSDPQKSGFYSRIVNKKSFDAVQHPLSSLDPKKMLVGGKIDREDLYITPTVVGPLEHNDPGLMQEKMFSPIFLIIPVEDMGEAVQIADQSDDTSMQGRVRRAHKLNLLVMSNTNSDGILMNDVIMHVLDGALPFSGVGPSGIGAYHGAKSFETFSHKRSTMIKISGLESLMKACYPPYTDEKLNLNDLLLIGLLETFIAKIDTIYQAIGSAYRTFFSK